MPIKINEKLFAHIHNDPFLIGSVNLEGNSFTVAIDYLKQYLETLDGKVVLPNEVQQLLIACKELSRITSTLFELIVTPNPNPQNTVKALAEDIVAKACALKEKNYLLIPGGWASQSGGHAMVYQFDCAPDGDLLLHINNTGSGLQFHEKRSSTEHEQYHSILTYKIPKASLDGRGQQELVNIVEQLLTLGVPSLHQKKSIEPKELYQDILFQLVHLNATIEPAHNDQGRWFTKGQLSGTCTQRSIHHLLKACFVDMDDYRRFIFDFKMKSLEDYYDYLTADGQYHNPKIWPQFERAIRHQIRFTASLFNDEEKTKRLTWLTERLGEMHRLREEQHAQAPQPAAHNAHPQAWGASWFFSDVAQPATSSRPSSTRPPKVKAPTLTGGKNLLDELGGLIRACEALNTHGADYALLDLLEKVIHQLPLPTRDTEHLLPFYAGINNHDDDLLDFYNKINALQALYFDCCTKLTNNQYSTPKMYLAKMTFLTVVAHVSMHASIHAPQKTFYEQFASPIVYYLIKDTRDVVYLANQDPLLDSRMQQIKNFHADLIHNHRIKNDDEFFKFYDELLQEHPSLRQKLKNWFETTYPIVPAHIPLREAINKTKLDLFALYYFFNHYEELKSQAEFRHLTTLFTQQRELERCFFCYNKVLSYNHRISPYIPEGLNIVFDEQFKSLRLKGTPLSKSREDVALDVLDKCTSSKFKIDNPAFQKVFTRDVPVVLFNNYSKQTDNHTQLYPAIKANASASSQSLSGKIDKQSLAERELFHLRYNPETQIKLTLDYFSSHLHLLNEADYQIYLEANISQPGLLLAEITSNRATAFFDQIDAFIKKGLDAATKEGGVSRKTYSFIRLNYLVAQYAFKKEPEAYTQRMQDLEQQINSSLLAANDEGIKSDLHELRLLTHITWAQHSKLSPIQVNQLVCSNLFCMTKSNPNRTKDMDDTIKLKQAQYTLCFVLDDHKEWINPQNIIDTMKTELGIPLGEPVSCSGDYPFYQITDTDGRIYHVHVELGYIYNQQGQAYVILPTDIITHPVLLAHGLNNIQSGFLSADGTTYTIEQGPIKLLLIKNNNEGYFIQKRSKDLSGQEAYFELMWLNQGQQHHYQIKKPIGYHPLNRLHTERDVLCWKHYSKDELLLIHIGADAPYLQGGFENFRWILRHSNHGELLPWDASVFNPTLVAFEDKQFITTFEHEGKRHIEMPRYGLSFASEVDTHKVLYQWQGADYELEDEPAIEGIPSPVFHRGNNRLCIMPIQRFISSGVHDKDSEYYALTLDTTHHIADYDISELVQSKVLKVQDVLWQHSQTQAHYVFEMAQSKPIPQTPEEALYLCYVYLGLNKPDRAWDVLDDCEQRLGELNGHFNELRFIQWIFKELPHEIKNKPKACISNPEFEACKLKALSLLTAYKQQGKQHLIPQEISLPRNINERYENMQIEAISSFDNTLNKLLYEHYSRYQKMKPRQLKQFHLGDDARKSLLDYYHNTPGEASKPLGALGYEWVSLRLNELIKEQDALKCKEAKTDYECRRIAEIDDFIRTHLGVAKKTSRLVQKTIDTKIPDNLKMKQATLSRPLWNRVDGYERWFDTKKTPEEQTQAISALLPKMDEADFFNHFSAYTTIATQPDNPHRERLRHFCHSVLISSRHIPLEGQSTNIPLLCNVLYRFIRSGTEKTFAGLDGTTYRLLLQARALPAPKIEVFELVDDVSEQLKTAEQIVAELPQYQAIIPVKKIKDLAPTVTLLDGDITFKDAEYKEEEYKEEDDDNPLFSLEEMSKGKAQLRKQNILKQLAGKQFDKLPDLSRSIEERIKTLSAEQKQWDGAILLLANKGPSEKQKKQAWDIDLASGQRTPLEMRHLLSLFFQNNVAQYRQETGLDEEDIQKLHANLSRYVTISTVLQQAQRVSKQIERVQTAPPDEQNAHLLRLGNMLYEQNIVDTDEEPDLAVFQLHTNLLIRPIQKEALARLLAKKGDDGYAEQIERIIMGGGKSKVLLPTLAYKKATGVNLTIIEVPSSLLRTNFIDLKNTSQQLYGQKAQTFEFDRHSDCSARRLSQIHQQLTDIMVNKHYLVTTNTALQSLELKYLELLHTPPEQYRKTPKQIESDLSEWNEQVFWADKLVRLFRERADVMIDEVHQGLLLKNKLNYTLGESSNIPKKTIHDSLMLYKFLKFVAAGPTFRGLSAESMSPADEREGERIFFIELLKNNTLLSDEAYARAFATLARALVQYDNSPLKEITKTLDESQKSALIEYLQSSCQEIPAFIMGLSLPEKKQLALYKEEIAHVLPYTLKRNHQEHYGPSKAPEHTPVHRALAIPYTANNKPNERCRFANPIEALNFTIQSLVLSGIPKDLLCKTIETMQAQARLEVIDLKLSHLEHTPSAMQFRVFTDKYPLHQIDLNDKSLLDTLHLELQHHQDLIFDILEHQVLPSIKLDSAILHSDAYNHVDMVRSCQGMSGTPYNYRTFHQRLSHTPGSTEGLDALVFETFKQKTQQVIGFDFKNTHDAIKTLLDRYGDDAPVRCIIDINATFKGVANDAIAHELAQYFLSNQKGFKTIKFILYFNEHNQITALPLQGYPHSSPIVIGSSDPAIIQERLNCSPQERFTLYDQDHTVGVDILQAEQASALVMIDERTNLSDCFQGIMRMRSLIDGEQTLDVVVPSAMQGQTVDALCLHMHQQEQAKLRQDHFTAACSKLTNTIRSELLTKILAIEGHDAIQHKQDLFLRAKAYFIETAEEDFFKRYGGLSNEKPTREILEQLCQALITDYARVLQEIGVLHHHDEIHHVRQNKMQPIIEAACLEGVCDTLQRTSNSVLGDGVEVQMQINVQIEAEKEIQQEMYDSKLIAAGYVPWRLEISRFFEDEHRYLHFKTLNEICAPTVRHKGFEFLGAIKASCNFYMNYHGQTNYLGMYLKPVHALLFRRQNNTLECYILSQQESSRLCNQKEFLRKKNCWMATTQHTLLAGVEPVDIKHDAQYQAFIEQVRFFNGEFSSLLSGDMPLQWLTENPCEKMEFFEQHLYRCHETLPTHLAQMKARLFSNHKIYQDMVAHLNKQEHEYDWESISLNLDEGQLADAKAFCLLCNNTALNWETIDFNDPHWHTNTLLSPQARGYALRLGEALSALKTLVLEMPTWNRTFVTKRTLLLTQFTKFYPEYEQIFNPGQKIEDMAQALTSLIEERGLAPSKTLLYIIACSDNISKNQLQAFRTMAKSDPKLITALAKNHSLLITTEVLSQLLSYRQTKESLQALIEHRQFTPAHYLTAFNQAKVIHEETKIMSALLEKDNCPEDFIEALKSAATLKFKPQDIDKFASYLPDYRLLVRACSNLTEGAVKDIRWGRINKRKKIQETPFHALKDLINQGAGASFQKLVFESIAKPDTIAGDYEQLLIALATHSNDHDLLRDVLRQGTMVPDSIILPMITKKISSREILDVIKHHPISKAIASALLNRKLEPWSLISDNMLTTLLTQCKDLDEDDLLKIITRTNDVNVLSSICDYPLKTEKIAMALITHKSSHMLLQGFNNYRLTAQIMTALINHKACPYNVLRRIIEHADSLSEEDWLKLAHHSNLELVHFKTLVLQTKNLAILNAVIESGRCDQTLRYEIAGQGWLVNNALLRRILDKDDEKNTTGYDNTLFKLYSHSPKDITDDELRYLCSQQKIDARQVVFNFTDIQRLDILKGYLLGIKNLILSAKVQKITSNRYILFKTMSKKDKDEAIEKGLAQLNIALVKGVPGPIMNQFKELCRIACKRRNWLTTGLGKYTTGTHSALYLAREFSKNNQLLVALCIDTENKSQKTLIKEIQETMIEACKKQPTPLASPCKPEK